VRTKKRQKRPGGGFAGPFQAPAQTVQGVIRTFSEKKRKKKEQEAARPSSFPAAAMPPLLQAIKVSDPPLSLS
jgi:hypothetical protein